jgi:hypothetical protein
LVLGACSGGDGIATEVPRTRATAVRAPEPPPPDPLPGARTDPVATERTDERQLVLVEVQPFPGFDRVIFEFADAVPGFKADYVAELVQDGSGAVVPVAGEAKLVLRMSAGEPLETGTPERVVAGGLAVVTEAVRVSQVEDLVWAIGVRTKAPFTITAMDAPPRLVVDLKS